MDKLSGAEPNIVAEIGRASEVRHPEVWSSDHVWRHRKPVVSTSPLCSSRDHCTAGAAPPRAAVPQSGQGPRGYRSSRFPVLVKGCGRGDVFTPRAVSEGWLVGPSPLMLARHCRAVAWPLGLRCGLPGPGRPVIDRASRSYQRREMAPPPSAGLQAPAEVARHVRVIPSRRGRRARANVQRGLTPRVGGG